ncbi:hypothetical protein WMY93_030513 [Mugilogobius chulae]|uniref:Uncharacterized protein n=1 Tax=Mugilogobius chulae TaxID=88201 RepID=A0AAW0MEL9_9GOBI
MTLAGNEDISNVPDTEEEPQDKRQRLCDGNGTSLRDMFNEILEERQMMEQQALDSVPSAVQVQSYLREPVVSRIMSLLYLNEHLVVCLPLCDTWRQNGPLVWVSVVCLAPQSPREAVMCVKR